MKITRLVLLFNKHKIILGLVVATVAGVLATRLAPVLATLLALLSAAIVLNILLAVVASYILYDRSALYKPKELFADLKIKDSDRAIFLHASFDPVSRELEELIRPENLKVYNIYGNRHEDEKSVRISNRVFPAHPADQVVDPAALPDPTNSVDYIFAITSLHEILAQSDRVRFFEEAKRVLKDDGTLIVCEQMRDLTNFLFFNIGVFHFVSLGDWKAAISEAGLRLRRQQQITIWGTVLYLSK